MSSVEEEQIAEGLLREQFGSDNDPVTMVASSVYGYFCSEHGYAGDRPCPMCERIEFVTRMYNESLPSLYLAGPMTGLPEFNYPAFTAAAARLRAAGYTVINPAENHDGQTDLSLEAYFAEDLPQVCRTDALAVLPGWQNSGGARIEVALARHLGHPVLDAETLEPYRETALQEAQRLVHGDRGVAYGHPADDFGRTGKMWGAILGTDPIPATTVGLCMAAVKISREVNAPKRDNRVDLAGYAETIEMIHERAT